VPRLPDTAQLPATVAGNGAACRGEPRVDLYWIPLGAGGHSVRFNGVVYEAISSLIQHRPRRDVYHTALEIHTPSGLYAVEMTPVPNRRGRERGVVAEGSVGTGWVGRLRIFRYEVRRWYDGVIPDVQYAAAGPIRITDDPAVAQRVLDLLPSVPTPTWGRDELHAGEMWTCNSIISWALTPRRARHRHNPTPGTWAGAGMGRGHCGCPKVEDVRRAVRPDLRLIEIFKNRPFRHSALGMKSPVAYRSSFLPTEQCHLILTNSDQRGTDRVDHSWAPGIRAGGPQLSRAPRTADDSRSAASPAKCVYSTSTPRVEVIAAQYDGDDPLRSTSEQLLAVASPAGTLDDAELCHVITATLIAWVDRMARFHNDRHTFAHPRPRRGGPSPTCASYC
jgi:hypothetical protein